jgi:hypothetical protein
LFGKAFVLSYQSHTNEAESLLFSQDTALAQHLKAYTAQQHLFYLIKAKLIKN